MIEAILTLTVVSMAAAWTASYRAWSIHRERMERHNGCMKKAYDETNGSLMTCYAERSELKRKLAEATKTAAGEHEKYLYEASRHELANARIKRLEERLRRALQPKVN